MESVSALNEWLENHEALVIVLLAPILTFIVTHIVNRSAEKRAATERREERNLVRALKIADYRKDWIEELRDEFSAILAFDLHDVSASIERTEKLFFAVHRVALLANPIDPEFEKLLAEIKIYIEAKKNGEDHDAGKLTFLMRDFLKLEWEKLKTEVWEANFR